MPHLFGAQSTLPIWPRALQMFFLPDEVEHQRQPQSAIGHPVKMKAFIICK